MKGLSLALSVGALIFFAAPQARASGAGLGCAYQQSQVLGHQVRYCVQRSRPDLKPQPGEPVVYFFHEFMGDARSWRSFGYGDALSEIGVSENFPAFTVVSFDTEGMSFFADYKGKTPGPQAYQSWFISEFMNQIEDQLNLCHVRECRVLLGRSMGGFGALKTALQRPELFAAVGANSPGILPFSIYNPDGDWTAYFNRHPVGPMRGYIFLNKAREVFGTQANYDESNPIFLANNFAGPAPQIYFDVGDRDDYGFQEGFALFKQALDSRGIASQNELVAGGDHNMHTYRKYNLLRWLKLVLSQKRR